MRIGHNICKYNLTALQDSRMNKKAISLLSGGLDSTLATKLIIEQGIDVIALHFTSPFASKKEKERGLQAERTAKELGIRLILREKGLDYIEVVRAPEHGYGKNMNPCIDCRIFMLRQTKILMEEEQAGFVITGEVLGQRPMSQRRDTIHLIENASGLKGLIVRPLSAARFAPSIPEQEGVVDRAKLLGIAGRSRSVQYKLVAQYGIKEFGCPGGGCLLTEPVFSRRLKDLFESNQKITMQDIQLLSIGRHFRLHADTRLIIGRNKAENEKLESLCPLPGLLLHPVDFTGPTGILKGLANDEIMHSAANIIGYYGKNQGHSVVVEVDNDKTRRFVSNKTEIEPERLIV